MTQQEKEFVKANLNFNLPIEIPLIAKNHFERGMQEVLGFGSNDKCSAFEQAILAYPNYINAILEYVHNAIFSDVFNDPRFLTYLICKVIEYNPFNEKANWLIHELILLNSSNHLCDHNIASDEELFELIIKCLDYRDIINPNKVGTSESLHGQRGEISYNDSSLLRGIIMLYGESFDKYYGHEMAIEEFSKYTNEKVIDRIGIRFFISDAYFDAENYEEAEKEITKSIESNSPIWLNDKVKPYYFRSIIRRYLENYTGSLQDINRSIQLCTDYFANDESVFNNEVVSLNLLNKGITEYYLNNTDIAIADISRARELNSKLIESYLYEEYFVNEQRVNSEIRVLKIMFPDWNELDRYLEE